MYFHVKICVVVEMTYGSGIDGAVVEMTLLHLLLFFSQNNNFYFVENLCMNILNEHNDITYHF